MSDKRVARILPHDHAGTPCEYSGVVGEVTSADTAAVELRLDNGVDIWAFSSDVEFLNEEVDMLTT